MGPTCLGHEEAAACRHLENLTAHRKLSTIDQAASFLAGEAGYQPSSEDARGRTRVGFWAPCLGLGGAETWQAMIAESADPAKIAWRGAVVLDGRSSTHPEMVQRIERKMPVGFGRLAARALAASCDVILSWAVLDVEEILQGLTCRPKVIQAIHFPSEAGGWSGATQKMLEKVDRFVAVSELATIGLAAEVLARTSIVWNAVDRSRMTSPGVSRNEMRRAWAVPPEAKLAGFLGRLSPEKNPMAMIGLASELPANWHVVLVGEGAQKASLQEQSRAAGLERFHIVGADSRAGSAIQAMDCLIVPSLYESFGLAIAEGLWARTPVLSTGVGIAELVPGLTRKFEHNATPAELAAAVVQDHNDRQGTARRVERGHQFAEDRLSVDRFAADWTRVLTGTGPSERELRQEVARCPSRGGILPLSQQPDCGCSHRELSECRDGMGARPGRVTIPDCLDCRRTANR